MPGFSPLLPLLATGLVAAAAPAPHAPTSIYDFQVHRIDGAPTTLGAYRGRVMLIVNTASHCGFTPQYEGLEKLNRTYRARGLSVLGFPENDFMFQEPGSNAEIQKFCTLNYHVGFDMFEKSVVKGAGQSPLYHYLTSKETDPAFAGAITWNFNKFLIDRHGRIVARFPSPTRPNDPALLKAIETALKQR